MNRRCFLALALLPSPSGTAEPLTVFAAASLTDAFKALAAEGGTAARFSFGASSTLRTQVQQGAPADVIALADRETMRPLVEAGLVETPRVFARNRLALVVPSANPARLRGPADLARPGLRLVTTAITVPIGRYTAEALARLARLPGYPPEYVRRVEANIASRETNVRAALARVTLGEADAAIVYESDARVTRGVRRLPFPAAANVTAEYPAAVVRSTRRSKAARAFLALLLSPRGQSVLRRYGFR